MKLSELFREWEIIREELADMIRPLSNEQLAWIPQNGKNSIGDLARHISETEIWWFGNVVMGNDKVVDITPEMTPDSESIIKQLEKSRKEYTLKILEENSIEDFGQDYQIRGRETRISLFKLCWHVFEHECRLRGQILMLLRLQGIKPPVI